MSRAQKKTKKIYSFHTRLSLYIIPWMLLLIIGISIIFCAYVNATMRRERTIGAEQLMGEKARDFEKYFSETKSTIAYVSSLNEVTVALRQWQHMTDAQKYNLNAEIGNYLDSLNLFKNYLEDVIIIGKNGYCRNSGFFVQLKSHENPMEWECIKNYEAAPNTNFSYPRPYMADYYTSSAHMVYSVILPVYEQKEIIGYVMGNMSYEDFQLRLEDDNNLDYLNLEAIDSNGNYVFCREEKQLSNKIGDVYLNHMTEERGSFSIDDESYQLTIYRKFSTMGWIFMASIPYSSLLEPAYNIAKVMFLAVLPVTAIVLIILIHVLSKKIVSPIGMLVTRVEKAKPEETYEPEPITYEVIEVQRLGDEFDRAMARIHELIQNEYASKIEQQKMEFKILANQITPHFMHNSLQLIKAEAILSGNKDISRIVTAFANLLRYSMDINTDMVTLEDEINYLADYLELYKRRYVDKFDYEIAIPDEIRSQMIPKMTLQPIVENSIQHGLKDIREGGYIKILGEQQGERIILSVHDTGTGIPENALIKLQELLQGAVSSTSGIGLVNVHRRLIMEYGEAYGVTDIYSERGDTCVSLSIKGASEEF